jgi:hypothetical protein
MLPSILQCFILDLKKLCSLLLWNLSHKRYTVEMTLSESLFHRNAVNLMDRVARNEHVLVSVLHVCIVWGFRYKTCYNLKRLLGYLQQGRKSIFHSSSFFPRAELKAKFGHTLSLIPALPLTSRWHREAIKHLWVCPSLCYIGRSFLPVRIMWGSACKAWPSAWHGILST